MSLAGLTVGDYPGRPGLFLGRGIVRDVDARRLVPRADQVLADPRLAAALTPGAGRA
jgi:hypothetical protein